ncbi:MAG: hypothetical protein ABI843_05725, partial [Dokdonella sp.]
GLSHARVGHRQGLYQNAFSYWGRRSLLRAARPATGHRQGFYQNAFSYWGRRSLFTSFAKFHSWLIALLYRTTARILFER